MFILGLFLLFFAFGIFLYALDENFTRINIIIMIICAILGIYLIVYDITYDNFTKIKSKEIISNKIILDNSIIQFKKPTTIIYYKYKSKNPLITTKKPDLIEVKN